MIHLDTQRSPALSRRGIIAGSAGTAVGTLALTACGGDDETASPGTPSAGGDNPPSGAATPLAVLADVPVGGAVSATGADGAPLIVAQPTEGQVVAFSAICTHKGCQVAPEGDELMCPCHGSTYDLATGENTGGPAPSPLTEIAVTVEDGNVVEA
ncbi:Rieske (2Fe-2S) protein [Nocardioides sp.]|uniref:Rieske (2Fe-2S) protein n=1 Tax=Nocardioides sp. TaxID=35761 RepID=UPI00286C9873|nr:Rieske (2Fe-2S) protein [Nocardioides sp.]